MFGSVYYFRSLGVHISKVRFVYNFRSLGVHISKVRSITLDAWEPEQLKVMTELGNDIINRIYEANVDENKATRASAECSRFVKTRNTAQS